MARHRNAQTFEAQGWSRGGLSTKIHGVVDALGNLVGFILTQGQASEYEQAKAMMAGFQAHFVLADKGYDANEFIETIQSNGAVAVMPARKNRLDPRAYDKIIDKERNVVERLFQRLKHYRSIATRDERLASNDMAMLSLVATFISVSYTHLTLPTIYSV